MMAEPVTFVAALERFGTLIAAGLVFLLGLLGWMGRRQVNRLDIQDAHLHEIERCLGHRVTREEFNGTVNSIRAKIEESEKTLTERIEAGNRGTHERLDRFLERER